MKILLATLFVLSFSIDLMAQNDFERIVQAEKKSYLHIHKSLQGAENNYNVIYQRLNLNVNPNIDYIAGKVTTYFIAESTMNSIEFDLSDSLSVDRGMDHNTSVSFTHISDVIHINFL